MSVKRCDLLSSEVSVLACASECSGGRVEVLWGRRKAAGGSRGKGEWELADR